LGADDQCITDFTSETNGEITGVIANWENVSFTPPEGSPPNPPGWSGQSLLAISEMSPPYLDEWLHYETPTIIATFALDVVFNPSLIGQTVECLAPGINSRNGDDVFGDTTAMIEYQPLFFVPQIIFIGVPGICDYIVGDVNGIGGYNGLDVTYGVTYFKEGTPVPPYECECTAGNTWYVAGDVNNSCTYNGLDITYSVNWFKEQINPPIPCADCPPFIADFKFQKE
jgi:hypothetical protein